MNNKTKLIFFSSIIIPIILWVCTFQFDFESTSFLVLIIISSLVTLFISLPAIIVISYSYYMDFWDGPKGLITKMILVLLCCIGIVSIFIAFPDKILDMPYTFGALGFFGYLGYLLVKEYRRK